MKISKILIPGPAFRILILSVLTLQVLVWYNLKSIKPELAILPELPGKYAVKVLSLGDDQLFFRLNGYKIQTAGDTFGRSTPLKNYDYAKLLEWFRLLDSLDADSNYIPSLAAYYFSQTQNHADTRYIVDYLVEHASRDLDQKWWWLTQAVLIAQHKLKDKELALDIARKLTYVKADMPMWARQLPAFLLADMGENDQAAIIMRYIAKNYKNLPEKELNFMYYFLKNRLDTMVPPELKAPQQKN